MPYANNRGTSIYYETMGHRTSPPILLLEGFTKQLIGWKPEFCRELVDRGLFVIRMDNRDVGLSQKFGGREDFDGMYAIEDMADDAVSVLDDLGIETAHLGGQSMGGMLAQIVAARHPRRVLSLTLFYTSGGDLRYVAAASEQRPDLETAQPDRTQDEYVAYYLENEQWCRSQAYAFDEDRHRQLATLSYQRCYAPDGPARQAAGLMRSPRTWTAELAGSSLPMAVIHGRSDLLIDYHASIDIAETLPNAELHLFPGLGHEIPRELIDEFVGITVRTVERGQRAR